MTILVISSRRVFSKYEANRQQNCCGSPVWALMVGFRRVVIRGAEATSDCSGSEFDYIFFSVLKDPRNG